MSITPEDVMVLQGEVASPAALKKGIEELRSTVRNWKAATTGALITAVATAIAAIFAAVIKLREVRTSTNLGLLLSSTGLRQVRSSADAHEGMRKMPHYQTS